MSYPGGKNGAGVFQRLINQIPPHDVYIEPFLGGGAIMRNKLPSKRDIGVDIDEEVFRSWQAFICQAEQKLYHIICDDAVTILRRTAPNVKKETIFVYCDPPYLMETRKSGPLYKYEYTKDKHVKLLELLLSLKMMVMISGYPSALYDETLCGWRKITYQTMTRGGSVSECAWMNYPQPKELHDYRYIGEGFRDREKINRRIGRWLRRLEVMPLLERNAMIAAINNMDNLPEPDPDPRSRLVTLS